MKSTNERVSVLETKANGHDEEHAEIKDSLEKVAKSVVEAVEKLTGKIEILSSEISGVKLARERDKGFFAGMCFAYGTIGVAFGGLIVAAFNYFMHKPT